MKIKFYPQDFPRKTEILDILETYKCFMPWWANETLISCMAPEDDDESAGASCTHQKHYRRIAIQISVRNIDRLDLKDLLLHEICHSYNEALNDAVESIIPLYVDGKRDQKVVMELFDRRVEEQTEDLCIMLANITKRIENIGDNSYNGEEN